MSTTLQGEISGIVQTVLDGIKKELLNFLCGEHVSYAFSSINVYNERSLLTDLSLKSYMISSFANVSLPQLSESNTLCYNMIVSSIPSNLLSSSEIIRMIALTSSMDDVHLSDLTTTNTRAAGDVTFSFSFANLPSSATFTCFYRSNSTQPFSSTICSPVSTTTGVQCLCPSFGDCYASYSSPSVTPSGGDTGSGSSNSSVGAIIGAVVGSVCGVALIALLVVSFAKRRTSAAAATVSKAATVSALTFLGTKESDNQYV
jgi:hypothetical protein